MGRGQAYSTGALGEPRLHHSLIYGLEAGVRIPCPAFLARIFRQRVSAAGEGHVSDRH